MQPAPVGKGPCAPLSKGAPGPLPIPVHSRAPEGSTVKDPPIQPTPNLRAEAAQRHERQPEAYE